ncbi:MAG: hypothetical protein AAGL18_08110, partial [Pseudomonadota bacterium]
MGAAAQQNVDDLTVDHGRLNHPAKAWTPQKKQKAAPSGGKAAAAKLALRSNRRALIETAH